MELSKKTRLAILDYANDCVDRPTFEPSDNPLFFLDSNEGGWTDFVLGVEGVEDKYASLLDDEEAETYDEKGMNAADRYIYAIGEILSVALFVEVEKWDAKYPGRLPEGWRDDNTPADPEAAAAFESALVEMRDAIRARDASR